MAARIALGLAYAAFWTSFAFVLACIAGAI
jgi:hypothetical protein